MEAQGKDKPISALIAASASRVVVSSALSAAAACCSSSLKKGKPFHSREPEGGGAGERVKRRLAVAKGWSARLS
jgi:hypothetical protein